MTNTTTSAVESPGAPRSPGAATPAVQAGPRMSARPLAASRPVSAWRSPWVIGWIGLVLTVLAVNATMVTLAINTNPGLVRADYYEGGRDVERTIVTRLEGGPGWTMNIDTPAGLQAEQPTTIRFFVVDKAGQPVAVEQVDYYAYRPANADQDIAVPMEQEAPGRYAVRLAFPLGGVWDTLVSVRDGDQEYAVAQRISVARP